MPNESNVAVEKNAGAETAFQRSRVYELLAHAFAEPSLEFLEFLKDGAFPDHIEDCLRLHPGSGGADRQSLTMLLREAKALGLDELRSAYERLTAPEMNVLYECNYHPPLTSSVEMADVAGFYRAFGLDFSGDRPDHISRELEFMRLLAVKEAKALMDRDKEKGEICVSAQKSFLSSHVGRWTSILSRMTEGVPLYGRLGRFLHGWITTECGYFSIDADEIFFSRSGKDEDADPEHCSKEVRDEGI
jgi:hypothetical protein